MYNAFFSYSTVADMIIPALCLCLPRTDPLNRWGEGQGTGKNGGSQGEKKIVAPSSNQSEHFHDVGGRGWTRGKSRG